MIRKSFLSACLGLFLAACAVGPDYERPDLPTPARFKEFGAWKAAEPKDGIPRGNWWEVYGDPVLDDLVERVGISNQNVAMAEAQYRGAVAALGIANASMFPSLNPNFSRTRTQGVSSAMPSSVGGSTITPGAPIREVDRLTFNAAWEIDLWGRVRRGIEAGETAAAASAADLDLALLSARAALVQSYLQLRINEAQRRLLDETTVAYERSLEIARNRYDAGVVGRIDVTQAETQLKTTRAQAIDLGIQRAQFEHAIALLLGVAPSDFSLPVTASLPDLPSIPAGLPSDLLERRPDIAAAERRVASANAQIGVAQAAFFPALTLTGNIGYQTSTGLTDLIMLPNRFWSVGPSLALALFDGGARFAQRDQIVAAYDRSVAAYRQSVLTAFQEVEDNLAALRILDEETDVQREAVDFAAESLRLTYNQYQTGIVSYLNVVTAQATSLSTERVRIELKGRKLLASLALIKALGGGWTDARKPAQDTVLDREARLAPDDEPRSQNIEP
ncbi:MAG: efflux transporter outer membrane subunit [Candidatus Accumulibacter sp.]|jgi:NodT family efflux transporter outer membrane factor (OMF) lipoprotein|nr:efflux transporter outer membrane subunit [Accumulibacter sp.]